MHSCTLCGTGAKLVHCTGFALLHCATIFRVDMRFLMGLYSCTGLGPLRSAILHCLVICRVCIELVQDRFCTRLV